MESAANGLEESKDDGPMQINLMIIGDSGVGKTSIIRAYANKPF